MIFALGFVSKLWKKWNKFNLSNYDFESTTVVLGCITPESVYFDCFVVALVDLGCQLDSLGVVHLHKTVALDTCYPSYIYIRLNKDHVRTLIHFQGS